MKLFAASIAGLDLIASPVLAQPDNTTSAQATHVKTTTKQVHATNVPVRKTHHHVTRKHHHAMRCGCPPRHMKAHHAHHVVKQTTRTTKTPG